MKIKLLGGCQRGLATFDWRLFLGRFGANLKVAMKKRRVFDEAFKEMAVELSYAKDSVQEAARELGIDSSRITKWRKLYSKTELSALQGTALSDEQKQIRRLQKELKDALLERDILKTGAPDRGRSASFPGATGDIPIYSGARQPLSP